MSSFSYRKIEKLPRLAWCARLSAHSDAIIVVHGPWVETRKDCFFAAAWSGTLDEARPDEAVVCCGTGARLDSGASVFFASSNLGDRLYLKQEPEGVVISNSLTYLLVATDDEPAPNIFMYSETFMIFAGRGIRRKERSVPTRRGQIEVYECCNLKFGKDLKPEWREKPAPPAPSSYEQYISLLETHLESVLANAADESRIVSYSPVSNVSSGYDSAFAAALARKQGVSEAITFSEEIPGIPDEDDGSPIAEILGIDVHTFARRGYPSTERFPEAEFLACPPGWESPMGATERFLGGKININGYYGGIVLGTDRSKIVPDLAQKPITTAGMNTWEYRLRIGCLDFSLFYTGWQHTGTVQEISTSEAMRPWSIGGDYDRPISRRTLEEAGVPRELFGQVKRVGAAEFLTTQDQFRPVTWADLENFIDHFTSTHPAPAKAPERYLYHWGFHRTRERYDDAFEERSLDGA